MFGITSLTRFGPSFTIIFVSITAYAITKTGLMDIRLVIGKTAAHTVTVFIFGSIYTALTLIYTTFISPRIDLLFWAITLIYGVFTGNFYIKTKDHIQTPFDRFFIKTWYDFSVVAEKISGAFKQIASRSALLEKIPPILEDEMDIQKARFFFFDSEKDQYVGYDNKTFEPIAEEIIPANSTLIKKAETQKVAFKLDKDTPFDGYALIVPVLSEERVSAFIALTKKRSEEDFDEQDLRMLNSLGANAAMAINFVITPYEEVKKKFEATEQKLADAQIALSRSERLASLGTLTAGVTHEIRNPLAVIRSKIELLSSQPRDQEYVKNFSEITLKHIDRIESIVERMLAISRSNPTKKEKVNLNSVFETALQLVKLDNITITKQFGEIPEFHANQEELDQIFVNLIQNAKEAMPQGGSLTLATRSETDDKGKNYVYAEVVDTGRGVPPELFEKIFDPFYSTRHEGTGLGLSIAYKFTRENNGDIKIKRSEVGRGSTFEVRFPVG